MGRQTSRNSATLKSFCSKEKTPAMFRIKGWDENFESAQTRRVKGQLRWVLVPTRHDGKSFRRLLREEDGMALFGAWVVILEVAAKCKTRGVLEDEEGPLTAEDIADATGAPAAAIQRAFEVLSSKEIKWLVPLRERSERAPTPSTLREHPALEERGGEERRGEERKAGEASGPELEVTKESPSSYTLSGKPDSEAVRRKAALAVSIAKQAREVFNYWREVMSHPMAIFGNERKRKVEARLKQGFTVERLKRAIDGCKKDPGHSQGKNERGTVYDDIELICRDSRHVEMFIAYLDTGGKHGSGRETASERNVRETEDSFRRIEQRFGPSPDHRPDPSKESPSQLTSGPKRKGV